MGDVTMRAKNYPSLRERFDSKWEPVPWTGCWVWTGWLYRNGYGRFSHSSRKHELAHRLAYKLYVGDPGSAHVCHTCDVRCCVNPDHMFLGDRKKNMADMAAKGRSKAGRGKLPFGVYKMNPGRPSPNYGAKVWRGGQGKFLGSFPTVELAHAAAVAARQEYLQKVLG